jgi:hypothetical protein
MAPVGHSPPGCHATRWGGWLGLVAAVVLGATGGARAAPPKPADRPAEHTEVAPAEAMVEEARRHFNLGESYYSEGRYQEAVAAYRKAYEIKPHPAGLYNIAQAYERLLQYREAVTWFELYLKEPGTDSQTRTFVMNRLRVLRSLPARVQVDCVPQATATLIDPDGLVEQARTPHVFEVKAGHYTLNVTRPGYLPQQRRLSADMGQPYFHQFTLQAQLELVRIRPTPVAARVFVDQRLVGTGFFADRLPVGKHTLLVEYGQYDPYATDFELKPGHRLEYDIVLAPPPPKGRAEFIAGMAAYGALALPLGLHATGVLRGEDRLLMLSTGLGGAGLFALGGFFLTPRGIRQPNASLLLAGTTWGSMEGLALAWLTDSGNARLASGLTLGASVVGLGTALLLIRPLQPTPGQSALLQSGGLWGSALGVGLGYAIRGDRRDLNLTLLIGLNVGLITSGVLINHSAPSRTRMFLVDLGGLAGSASGFAIAFATFGQDPTKSDAGTAQLARGALLGGAAGLTLAAVLTRRFDATPSTITRDSLVSFDDGRPALGLPRPQVMRVVSEAGTRHDTRVTLSLAGGRF